MVCVPYVIEILTRDKKIIIIIKYVEQKFTKRKGDKRQTPRIIHFKR